MLLLSSVQVLSQSTKVLAYRLNFVDFSGESYIEIICLRFLLLWRAYLFTLKFDLGLSHAQIQGKESGGQ